jgi:hypothetical protein
VRLTLVELLGCITIAGLVLYQLTLYFDQETTDLPVERTAAFSVIEEGHDPAADRSVSRANDDQTPRIDRPRSRRLVTRSPAGNLSDLHRRNDQVRASGSDAASRAEVSGNVAPLDDETPQQDPTEDQSEDPHEDQADDEPRPRSLSGWVFDEAGSGVHDLQVTAKAKRLAQQADAVSAAARSATARTDGEGFFVLPGLLEGEYAVRTESTDRYESAFGMFRAGVDSAVLVVVDKTSRWTTVRGFVESVDGGSLENAQVVPVSQFANRTSTDGQGAYELRLELDPRRRAQMVRYMSEGFREQRLTIGDQELDSGEAVIRDVLLEPLQEKTTVTGSVVSGDGSPVYRAHIGLYSASIGRRADGATDRDGIFSIADVEHADDYRLWVRPPSGFKEYLEENLVVTGWVDLDIVVEEVEWSRIEGQMVDPDGHPVPGFTLWLRTAEGGAQRDTPVTGDGLGRFKVEQLPSGGAVFQTLASPFLSISGIELAPGNANRIRLRLDFGSHSLGGFVVDPDGGPVAGACVFLFWSVIEHGIRSRSKRETFSDANGYFLFTALGASGRTLTVTTPGFRNTRLELDTRKDYEEITIQLVKGSP